MRLSTSLVLLASFAALSACGGASENGAATETRMDDLDSLEGTISDDAINTDQSTEEGPIEAAPAPTAQPREKTERKEDEGEDKAAATETDDKADTE